MKSLLGLQGTFKESEMFIHIRSQISGLQGIVLLAINVCGHVVPVFREGFSRWLWGAVPYAEAQAPAPSLSDALPASCWNKQHPMGFFHTVFTEKGIKCSVQKNQEGLEYSTRLNSCLCGCCGWRWEGRWDSTCLIWVSWGLRKSLHWFQDLSEKQTKESILWKCSKSPNSGSEDDLT